MKVGDRVVVVIPEAALFRDETGEVSRIDVEGTKTYVEIQLDRKSKPNDELGFTRYFYGSESRVKRHFRIISV